VYWLFARERTPSTGVCRVSVLPTDENGWNINSVTSDSGNKGITKAIAMLLNNSITPTGETTNSFRLRKGDSPGKRRKKMKKQKVIKFGRRG
jgi:hypothetical protein